MKPFLRAQLERYTQRLGELDFLLAREEVMRDQQGYRSLSREHAEMSAVVSRWNDYRQAEDDALHARDMLDDATLDEDMQALATQELESAQEIGRAHV